MSTTKSKREIIGIPHGTRLHAIVLIPPSDSDKLYERGGETHVWTACKQRGPDYSKWQGTYLRIENNGRITRVTVDDNYTVDDEFVIKEADR